MLETQTDDLKFKCHITCEERDSEEDVLETSESQRENYLGEGLVEEERAKYHGS